MFNILACSTLHYNAIHNVWTILQKNLSPEHKGKMGKTPGYSTVLSKGCERSRNSKIRNKQECGKRCLSVSKQRRALSKSWGAQRWPRTDTLGAEPQACWHWGFDTTSLWERCISPPFCCLEHGTWLETSHAFLKGGRLMHNSLLPFILRDHPKPCVMFRRRAGSSVLTVPKSITLNRRAG